MEEPRPPALVLIADDDVRMLEVVSSLLADSGMDSAVVSSGLRLLQIVGQEMPDLILLDAVMPGLDGFETCKRLKQDPVTQGIPVIFMTSLTEAEHKVRAFEVGAVDYVTKPFEQSELVARARTQIALGRATRDVGEKNARLLREIQERLAAEQVVASSARELERRTQELFLANERLSQELVHRERAEAAQVAMQKQIIAVQEERLSELSTPLIPITDAVLIMPLIGAMDDARARQAIEIALRGAAEHKAHHLIIDITGVRQVDGMVANMLVQLAKGLSLLGTRSVITGVRPNVAQSLLELELDLKSLVTKRTLQGGVEHALRAHGRHRPRPAGKRS